MGKTAFGLGMAASAALEAQRPVLFFSLEMGHLELTQRLLCSDARVDSQRMRNGNLSEDDWPKITRAVGKLGDIGAWSFCQDKIMTTGGEGGMVTTSNKQFFDIPCNLCPVVALLLLTPN